MEKIEQTQQKINNYLNYLYSNKIKPFKHKKFVIGISCGIDSTLALCILLKYIPKEQILPIFIDIESNEDKEFLTIIKTFFLNLYELNIDYVNLDNEYYQLINKFKTYNYIQKGNIKARLRMMYLYNLAHINDAVVVNTLNYSEYFIGYFTKHTDGVADLNLLNGIIKTDICIFAKFFNLPLDIILRSPTSGLNLNINDEDELKFTYHDLDNYILKKEIELNTKNKIFATINKNLHKILYITPFLNKPYRKYLKPWKCH